MDALVLLFALDSTGRSAFAAFRGEPTPGENGGGDSVLGATRVFVSGSVQLGKNLGEFSLGSGVYAGTQFSDPIFNASGGWHRGMQNGAPQQHRRNGVDWRYRGWCRENMGERNAGFSPGYRKRDGFLTLNL